jgi:enamine deaminase RidA (YjgF/YER057c/UK114 family)
MRIGMERRRLEIGRWRWALVLALLSPVALGALAAAVAAQGRAGPAPRSRSSVPRERINPAELVRPTGYSHVVATRGGRQVFVSGQVALDADGNLVGKADLKAQAEKVFEHLRVALAAAGATTQDVVKLNTYVVGFRPADLAVLREARSRAFGDAGLPASTLVGVQALAREGLLIEIEAIAVVP